MLNPEREQIVKELVEELNKEYPEYGFGYYTSIGLGVFLVVSKAPYKEWNGWSLFRSFDEINKGYANDKKNELRNVFLGLKGLWQKTFL